MVLRITQSRFVLVVKNKGTQTSLPERLKLHYKKKITIKSGKVLKVRRENEMETDFSELCRACIRRITEKKCVKGMAAQNNMM